MPAVAYIRRSAIGEAQASEETQRSTAAASSGRTGSATAPLAMRQRRGDVMGHAPMGYRTVRDSSGRIYREKVDPEAITRVIEAYKAAGTLLGAARALNAAGVPCPRPDLAGGNGWHAATVRRIIRREAPDLLPADLRRGQRGETAPRILAGLLRCPCGTVMTPGASEKAGALYYYCNAGLRDRQHPRPYTVSERKLLPWIKDEAAKLRTEVDEVGLPLEGQDDSAERQAIAVLRAAGHDVSALEAALAAKADALEARRAQWEALPPAVDWQDWTVEEINRALRTSWNHVRLGPDLMPLEAEWRVPGWRAKQNV